MTEHEISCTAEHERDFVESNARAELGALDGLVKTPQIRARGHFAGATRDDRNIYQLVIFSGKKRPCAGG